MEPLSVILIVVACLAGWVVVSVAAAFVFGRLIGRADEERRARRLRKSSKVAQTGSAQSGSSRVAQTGVVRGSSPPERATIR